MGAPARPEHFSTILSLCTRVKLKGHSTNFKREVGSVTEPVKTLVAFRVVSALAWRHGYLAGRQKLVARSFYIGGRKSELGSSDRIPVEKLGKNIGSSQENLC